MIRGFCTYRGVANQIPGCRQYWSQDGITPAPGRCTYNRMMESRKAITFLKSFVAAMALACVIALVVHPVATMGFALLGLLFVPVMLWLLGPMVSDALPASLEQPTSLHTLVLVSRFQRPPPSLL